MHRFLPLALLAGLLALAAGIRAPSEARAGTALRLDLPTLVELSDLILEGRVESQRVVVAPGGRIETEHLLHVERCLWGEAGVRISVRLPGGVLPESLGGGGLLLPGMPTIAAGEELLLFLSEPSPGGLRVPVGLAQGKLRVERDASGARTLVREQLGLELVDPRTGAVEPAAAHGRFDYDPVLAAIERQVQLKAQRRATEGAEGR